MNPVNQSKGLSPIKQIEDRVWLGASEINFQRSILQGVSLKTRPITPWEPPYMGHSADPPASSSCPRLRLRLPGNPGVSRPAAHRQASHAHL